MIEMIKDVMKWDMSNYEKIAIIEMLVEEPPKGCKIVVHTHTWQEDELAALQPFAPKPKVHKGPVAGTYRRGILWARCKEVAPKKAAKLVYGNLSNSDMEKFLARLGN